MSARPVRALRMNSCACLSPSYVISARLFTPWAHELDCRCSLQPPPPPPLPPPSPHPPTRTLPTTAGGGGGGGRTPPLHHTPPSIGGRKQFPPYLSGTAASRSVAFRDPSPPSLRPHPRPLPPFFFFFSFAGATINAELIKPQLIASAGEREREGEGRMEGGRE